MKKNDSIYDHYLEDRLAEWARWYNDFEYGNLGWPKESLFVKVIMMGVFLKSTRPLEPVNNERAEEVNFWVKRLEKIYPLYAQALRIYYFYPDLPNRKIAHEFKISISTLKQRVQSAKIWLSGLLSAYKSEIA
jgi:hypothetical protein